MKKDIKDYLPFYLGIEMYADGYSVRKLTPLVLMEWDEHYRLFKLILRPLSDMTGKDAANFGWEGPDDTLQDFIWQFTTVRTYLDPHQFYYSLKQEFDIFDLIPAGLAIDKTKHHEQIHIH